MAGIFPAAGTAAANTANAASPVNTAPGCDPLYHRIGCVPVFDPAAANALISEIVNAVNTLSPYDCTRLDNLANVLSTISDLCKLPTLAEIGVGVPDLDDTLAGCFDGNTAQVSISALAALINAQKSICGLQDVGSLADTDYVAVCANPGDGYRDAKLQFSLLKQLIGNQSKAAILIPGPLILNFAGSGSNSFNVAGFQGFIAFVEASEGFAGFRIGNLVSGNGLIEEGNMPLSFVPPGRLLPFVKKDNTWFCTFGGAALACADGDNIPYDGLNDGGGFQRLRVWQGFTF